MRDDRGAILIVDDDPIVTGSLQGLLDEEGYVVETRASVEQSLGVIRRKPFDLVLADVNMPHADGFELLRVMRPRFADTAIVLITGYGTIEGAVEAIKLGAYDYLTKPIIDDELRLVVRREPLPGVRVEIGACWGLRRALDRSEANRELRRASRYRMRR